MLRTLSIQTSYPGGALGRAGRDAGPRARRGTDPRRGSLQGGVHPLLEAAIEPARIVCAPAPERRSPAVALTLPALATGVPTQVRLQRDDRVHARIAAALLEVGLVEAADWDGSFTGSLEAGLGRWLTREIDRDNPLKLPCYVAYTDDVVEAIHFHTSIDREEGAGPVVGGFMIRADAYLYGLLGAKVQLLNEVEPGLGWDVMAMLCCAFSQTLGAFTPADVRADLHDRIEEFGEEDTEILDSEDGWGAFFDNVPQEAMRYRSSCSKRRLLRAVRRSRRGCYLRRGLSEIPSAAVALMRALGPGFKGEFRDDACDFIGSFGYQLSQVVPIAIRWCDEDRIDMFVDEHHQYLMETGEKTDVVWLASFNPLDPASILAAARRFRCVLEVLGLAVRLLNLMHTEEPPAPEAEPIRLRALTC